MQSYVKNSTKKDDIKGSILLFTHLQNVSSDEIEW